jgi:hypothetical protein
VYTLQEAQIKGQSLERLTKKIFSVMAEHRHVLHVLLFIVQSASMTKTATTAEKVR